MINIVVFGKPRSFESYEFEFDGQHLSNPRNTHPEPIVKHPDTSWGPIYHYFKREGIDGLELYAPCEGFDSDRPGIIFGVGLKSNHDFDLTKTIDLLTRYWGDLATAFIDGNNKFTTSTIVDTLHNTEWSEEEVSDIRNTIKPNTLANIKIKKELLLLVANDITEIENAEMSIKQYADVYIANDTSLFRDLINRTVFEKQARGRIHSVTDGKIVVIADASIQDKKRRNLPGFSTKPQKTSSVHSSDKTGSSSEQSSGGADAETENGGDSTSVNSNENSVQSEGGTNAATNDKNKESLEKKRKKKKRRIITAIVLIAILVGAGVFFKPKPADRIELTEAPTTGYIFDGFNLQPTLYHGNSKRTSTDLKDITWKIEGDGERYIRIMDNNEIAIDPVFNTEKPRHDQSVTIIAYYKGRELGRGIYTLGKYVLPIANKVDMSSYPNPIKESFKIAPKPSFNGDQDVSTKIDDLRFEVQPEKIAKIEKIDNEYRLVVTNRPENDTQVTVTAYLDNQQIGQQTYTIAKKETTNNPSPPVDVDGKILCKRKSEDNSKYQLRSSFPIRDITNYFFIARDKNGTKLLGEWKCSGIDLSDTKKGENPLNFAEAPDPGTYTLEYWVGNQKRASINITITQ